MNYPASMRGWVGIVWVALVAATSIRAEEPEWVARAGTLRSSDPAVARKKGVVQWRRWGAETFVEAARTKRPIYVFVTAAWCRGGNEMERAAFSDPEAAKFINAEFIPIRLDRDALPETDLRLQQAVLAFKGVRGWPLNVVLTPDGEIFYGATSMSMDDDVENNRPGLRSTLVNLAQRWHDNAFLLGRDAAAFCRALKKSTEQPSLRGPIPADVLNVSALRFQTLLDRENGGFLSPVPAQFPAPRALEICLAHFARSGDKKSLNVVETTLDHMLRGGIYDQLAGGFHRFATDRQWRVPRFEKLPVMNAEMICLLLHAWQATGNGRYRAAAEESLNFWRGELVDGGTFFPASIAPEARSFEDGEHYSWSVRDLELLFTDPLDIRFTRAIYGIDEAGNQPFSAPGRTVLTLARSLQEVARELGMDLDAARQRFDKIRGQMLAARDTRARPPRDAMPLCDANSLMAAAFIEGGRLLGRDDLTRQGLKTLNAILKMREDGVEVPRPVRHVLDKSYSVPLAMDEAARAWACVQAFEATNDPRFRQLASEALDRLDTNYRDLLAGGYIERSFKGVMDCAPALNWRTKSIQDTNEPSTNGLIAQVYARLYAATGDAKYLERAQGAVESLGGVLATPSPHNGTLIAAADVVQNGAVRIKVICRDGDPAGSAMLSLANARYYPCKTVMRFDSLDAAGELPDAKRNGKKAFAIVETKGDKSIADSMEELNKFLDELGKSTGAAGASVPLDK